MEEVAVGQDNDVAKDSECMTGMGLYESSSRVRMELKAVCRSSAAGERSMVMKE